MSLPKQQRNLHSFIVRGLIRLPNVDAQLAQLRNTLFVYKLDLSFIRNVKYNPHNRLSCPNRAINLCVNLIASHRVALKLPQNTLPFLTKASNTSSQKSSPSITTFFSSGCLSKSNVVNVLIP